MSSHLTQTEKNVWKDQVEQSRLSDFNELKAWLKTKQVPFEEKTNGVNVNGFFVSNTLKVYFDRSKKGYQYNLEGVKERISPTNKQ